MTKPEPEPPVSQTGRRRVAVLGQLPNGEPCTLLFVQAPGGGWDLYRLGVTKDAIHLADVDVRKIVRVLSGEP